MNQYLIYDEWNETWGTYYADNPEWAVSNWMEGNSYDDSTTLVVYELGEVSNFHLEENIEYEAVRQ